MSKSALKTFAKKHWFALSIIVLLTLDFAYYCVYDSAFVFGNSVKIQFSITAHRTVVTP